jgi:hypothetical protein
MTVCGCTISLKAEVLPELKLAGHKEEEGEEEEDCPSFNSRKICYGFKIINIKQRKA